MVCLSDSSGDVSATVRDMTTNNTEKGNKLIMSVYSTQSVTSVFKEVCRRFNKNPESVELTIQCGPNDEIVLNDHLHRTLGEIGVKFDTKIQILILPLKRKNNMQVYVQGGSSSEDDLLLGASASPTSNEVPSNTLEPPPALMSIEDYYMKNAQPSHSSNDCQAVVPYCNNYVGLVNQAMTCYLNSLLQALYMTPEFRNALYNWEFDGTNPKTSIPFQLQRLFLNLQTSPKSSVETTELTQSFGWNVQEAWEQHDIQELCRVMFDALEKKFKNTEQANLINDLYEGKMMDYVKCLECSTESSREDTFQDIPLPVKPFGNNVAYTSVEEALRAFVQHETLDGTNQYFCEKCNKKCDAHKGLKFTKFPYLLTLHLKRFDFDYSTMNRIKLNDKVVFLEELNLNSFIPTQNLEVDESMDERVVKSDDCSTTDSGSALDDEGTDISSAVNGQDENQDDDEGIDVSSGNNHENEKNRLQELKGPYIYELFSIMIHSGSASGGHYYAYIKDFCKNEWFCFNDQSVSPVTQNDITKSYGGGSTRGYYSGAYTSSTNAYMLMYRQVDEERNCMPLTIDNFPPHIKQLLQDMRNKEESDRREKEKEHDMIKIKVFFRNPALNDISEEKIFIHHDTTMFEATAKAYEHFKLNKNVVHLEDCRLVAFDRSADSIECSFDPDCNFWEVCSKYGNHFLEVKSPDADFNEYKLGGLNMKVYYINLESENVEGPGSLWINPDTTVLDIKKQILSMYDLENVYIVQEIVPVMSGSLRYYLDDDNSLLKMDRKYNEYKLYVSNLYDLEDPSRPFEESKLASIIEKYAHVIMLEIMFPDTDLATLDKLSIPSLDLNQNVDKIDMGMGDRTSNSSSLRVSPQPGIGSCETFGDQSNSEDSSLSDSDRTLVGDAPGDNIGMLSSNLNSPADQYMSSPTEAIYDEIPEYSISKSPEEMHCDVDDYIQSMGDTNFYFKANELIIEEDEQRCCRVLVDKRTTLGVLKKNLEPILGVPSEYFKIDRQTHKKKVSWASMSDTLSSLKDNTRLFVKLGRVVRNNEFAGDVYYLQLDKPEPFTHWFEWILSKEQTVASAKRDILLQAKKQHMIDIPFSRCRLRKKQSRSPSKVYLDNEKFIENTNIASCFELCIQETSGPEKINESDNVAFIRQWHPSTLTLDPFEEIIIDAESRSVDDIKVEISNVSEIPVEFIEFGVVKSSFPCDMNVLEIQNELLWNPEHVSIYDDGSIFYYRDNREKMKELTSEERKELNQKENKRLGRANTGRSYPHRKENSLKIHLDITPKKQDD